MGQGAGERKGYDLRTFLPSLVSCTVLTCQRLLGWDMRGSAV